MAAPMLRTGKYAPYCKEQVSTFPGQGKIFTSAETGDVNSPGCTGNKKNTPRSSEVNERAKENCKTQGL